VAVIFPARVNQACLYQERAAIAGGPGFGSSNTEICKSRTALEIRLKK